MFKLQADNGGEGGETQGPKGDKGIDPTSTGPKRTPDSGDPNDPKSGDRSPEPPAK